MPGDYTRFTFAPGEDHIGVLMQQGRVLLDADFNELVEILERRIRVGSLDTYGRCVVPRTTPDGFAVGLSAGMLTIGRGRIYVDGILAENHGGAPAPPAPFDPVVAEAVGTTPVRYDQQPYLPNPPALPQGAGPHLVYVDVWQREITHLEEEDLLEKAVGVDSATRLQTVWQVKVLDDVGPGVTCATPADQIPKWAALNAPPAGRLTAAAVGVPADTDPCIVSPSGGYRGTENRLYRVEVHQGGAAGTATFKWSRDNASIQAAVLGMNAARTRLTLSRTARDAVLRFSPDQWVEVLDDRLELAGEPGVLAKVAAVDDVAGVLELAAALPAGVFDPDDPARHTRLRRWDQQGLVRDAANAVVADVDASGGAIPVPGAGNLVLEDGIQVEFSLSPAGGVFRTGDYWVFAARTVDASVEALTQAPPRGIHHHYCRLAVYGAPVGGAAGQPSDCRVFWPPECDCEGEGCDCTACVTAEDHNSGTFTLQMAVDQVIAAGGGKVCVGIGTFFLREPLRIANAQSLRLEGRGLGTILLFLGQDDREMGGAVEVANSIGVEVGSLSVFALGVGGAGVLALTARNVVALTVERCALVQFATGDRGGAAVGLSGFLVQVAVRDNLVFGTLGIATLSRFGGIGEALLAVPEASFAYTLGLYLEDNQILGTRAGVLLGGATGHLADARIAGNSVYFAQLAAIVSEGLVAPWARLDVDGNEIVAAGTGIAFGTDHTRVTGNDVTALPGRQAGRSPGDGILLLEALDDGEVDHAQAIGNRVRGVGGAGIRIAGRLGSAMIKQNLIRATGGGGIVMDEESQAGVLSLENNQLLEVDVVGSDSEAAAAIRLVRVREGDVSGNTITGFARAPRPNPLLAAIEVSVCHALRLSGNRISEIGPEAEFPQVVAGIVVQGGFDRLEVVDNDVRRGDGAGQRDGSLWIALWIGVGIADAAVLGDLRRIDPRIFSTNALVLGDPTGIGSVEALVGSRFAVLRGGRRFAGIRGNFLEARGRAPTVVAMTGTNCVFGENRCLQAPTDPAAPTVIALLAGDSLIASGNYLERPPNDRRPPALALLVDPRRFTAVGNVLQAGSIQVNGAALAAPWAPLNVAF